MKSWMELCLCVGLMLFSSYLFAETTATCTVTVIDINADPVSGAKVVVYERESNKITDEDQPRFLYATQKTNKEGRVVLEFDYKRARQVMIVAHKDGYALGWDVLPYRNDSNSNINIILDKPIILSGQVVDDKGQPVPGASVHAQPKISKMRRLEQTPVIGPIEWMTVPTDSNGRFQFNCFGEDVRSDFLVTAAASKTVYKFTPYPTSSCGYEVGREDIILTLPKQVAVRGQVVDDKGNGIADMTVVIKRDHRDKDNYYKDDYVALYSMTDKNGHFCFENVPGISHFLEILNTDVSKSWADKTITLNAADSQVRDKVVIQLETGGIMDVTMLDESTQKPIENMVLIFSQEPANENQWWFSRSFETNADGKVKAMLPAGQCKFRFWDERYQRTELKLPIVEKGKTTSASFTLIPNKPIAGTVKDLNNKPAADVSVVMTWGQTVRTNFKGVFECTYDSLREGMCLIARDIDNNRAIISVIGDPDEPVTLALKPALILTGTIVDTKDNPIPAARITLNYSGAGYLSDCFSEILTDKAGRFEVRAIPSDLPDGFSFRISVITMNHGALTYKKLKIQNETENFIQLEPIRMHPANQTLDGYVLDEDGNPVVSLPIFLNGDGQYHHTTFTDNKGRFLLRRLCEGDVRLQAGIGGEDFKPGRVTAHSSDTDVKVFMGQECVHVPEVSLVGKKRPDFDDIEIDSFSPEVIADKTLLICFWDFNQRSSRHGVSELAKLNNLLAKKGIEVALVHSAPMEEKAKEWIDTKGTFFNLGHIPKESEAIRLKWGVRGLPWLILTDAERKVIAEGFSVEELEEKLDSR